jgi:hypothetical protein
MKRYISDTLRKFVAERADHCCEYCKTDQKDSFYTFQIDHIISLKHGGSTTKDNLCYSCFPCNNSKGSDIGTILLPQRIFTRFFNPRIDIWNDHFEMEANVFYARTNIGEATIKILQLNDVERIIERQLLE